MTFQPKLGLGLGLAGSHRTGKSTILKALAEVNANIPTIWSATTNVAEQLGIKVGPNMKEGDRAVFQETVLSAFIAQWGSVGGVFLTDRTPLDFAAYALADLKPDSTENFKGWVRGYVERCLSVTTQMFSGVVVVQPGIPYVVDEGKPPPDLEYQEKVGAHVLSLALQLPHGMADVIPRDCTGLTDRVTLIGSFFSDVIRAEYPCCPKHATVH